MDNSAVKFHRNGFLQKNSKKYMTQIINSLK